MGNKKSIPKLKRSITADQMEMVSLGGATGVGLFIGSTSTIKWMGSSVLLAYMFVGLILYIVMHALGEMLYVNPGTGLFVDYATEYVHPLAGYLVEWANAFEYIVVGVSEMVMVAGYLKFWWPRANVSWSGIIITLFLVLVNLVSVKAYASLELWFAVIRVVTIILMIILDFIVIFLGVGNGGKPTGFSNLWSHGDFFIGGIKGFSFSMSTIVGSYEGIELPGISAGEAVNPQEAIIKSVKSVLQRILIFYVGAIFVIVTIYPWSELSDIGSPFATTFAKVGITIAASIINFVALTAALSGTDSGIYSSSHILSKLVHDGDAPKTFGHISKRIVPSHVILGISGGILIGFVVNMIAAMINKSTQDLFVIMFLSSVLSGTIPWFVILLAELKFRYNNQDLLVDHPLRSSLYPISNYFAFLMLIVIAVFMLINPETRISVLVGAAVLTIATTVYLIRHRKDGVDGG